MGTCSDGGTDAGLSTGTGTGDEVDGSGGAHDAPVLAPIPGALIARSGARTAAALLGELSDRLRGLGAVTPGFRDAVIAREESYPTGLPTVIGTAIPHTDPEHVRVPGVAVATLAAPVEFRQMGAPAQTVAVRLVVMLVLDADGLHTQPLRLQRLIGRLQDEAAVTEVLAAHDDADLTARVSGWLAGGA